jgi:cyclopropane-fatty-acyl-phospholipid synthase
MSFDDAQPGPPFAKRGMGLGFRDSKRIAQRPIKPLLRSMQAGGLMLTLPSGKTVTHFGSRPGPTATLRLHRWRALRRLAFGGDIGFAEGYMEGDWSTRDVFTLLEWAMQNEQALEAACTGSRVVRFAERLRHLARSNTRRGSRRNIQAHYDLGNAFYAGWLDAGMNYSSGVYNARTESLEEAQVAKLDRVNAMLALSSGAKVLEIGCGWGALLERLLTLNDCTATGITLSQQQLHYTRSRLHAAGLAERGSVRLRDYRDLQNQYDAIVSIEMLEAVGESYWATYFETLRDRLVPGGVAVLQVISIEEPRYQAYRGRPDFIQSYIFPGGMLPTVAILRDRIAQAGLSLTDVEMFGKSYEKTLAEWRARFLRFARGGSGCQPADQARFRRMWEYYLAYCQVGFSTGALDVGLYRIVRPR